MPVAPVPVRRPHPNVLGYFSLASALLALLFNLIPGVLLFGWLLAPVGGVLAVGALARAHGLSSKEAVAALIVTVASAFAEIAMYRAVVAPFLPG